MYGTQGDAYDREWTKLVLFQNRGLRTVRFAPITAEIHAAKWGHAPSATIAIQKENPFYILKVAVGLRDRQTTNSSKTMFAAYR